MIEEGKTLREIMEVPGMPTWEVIRSWLRTHEQFLTAYQAARVSSGEAFELRMLEEAEKAIDKDSAAAARVRIATLQWIASKRAPKVYGDKLALDVTTPAAQMPEERLTARIEELLAKARKQPAALPAPAKEGKR